MLKRILDLFLAAIGIFIFFPFLLAISCAVRTVDRGPVFYRGLRVGRNELPFRIYKFRTMVVNAEKLGGSSTSDDDPRITRVGKFLRKYKLDELPQLINVLKGEMSLVGPRPEVQHYIDMLGPQERKDILSVRPGITDWASIWNSDEGSILAGSSDPEKTYMERIRPEKIKLQLKYVRERRFLTDLKIVFQTLYTIIR